VLQCIVVRVAVCCSACCSVLHSFAVVQNIGYFGIYLRTESVQVRICASLVAVSSNVLQCVAVRCSVLQCVAVCSSVLCVLPFDKVGFVLTGVVLETIVCLGFDSVSWVCPFLPIVCFGFALFCP